MALISSVFISCSNPLEHKFNQDSLEQDILNLKDVISNDELKELVEYIGLSMSLGAEINGKTYNELLNEIKISKKYQKRSKNIILSQNIKEILNRRLKNDMCDEIMLEMKKKEWHDHNEKSNAGIEDDIYSIDY